MPKTSQLVISLLLAQGANAISLNKKDSEVVAAVAQDDMTDPKYLSEMTLENWKLFSQSESLQMYKHSQQNIASYEARISQYSIQSVDEDKKIIAAKSKLHEVTNESKKIVLEE